MDQNEYLKIKHKYEAVLFELLKEVANQLNYEDCNILYKEWAITLINASLDFDILNINELTEELMTFNKYMVNATFDTYYKVKYGEFEGKIIKQYD